MICQAFLHWTYVHLSNFDNIFFQQLVGHDLACSDIFYDMQRFPQYFQLHIWRYTICFFVLIDSFRASVSQGLLA